MITKFKSSTAGSSNIVFYLLGAAALITAYYFRSSIFPGIFPKKPVEVPAK